MYSKCQKCGRKLTDPDSMERGFGPECWESITGICSRCDMGRKTVTCEEEQIKGQMSFEDFPELMPEGEWDG